jgi:phosphatidylserine decarboxylase
MEYMKERLFDVFMPMLPKNDLSHWVGRLVHKSLPDPLARKTVEWFAKYYQINLDEAELPIASYKTIGELFTRKLKAGVRPLASHSVVHPADAQISEAGRITNLTMIQAKGKDYKVPELLRSGHFSADFEGGTYFTYYLCPTDYHRVHSPVDGEIIWSSHVPGELWPVNSWSVNAIPNLFAVNERVVVIIQTPRGKAALVMVAATNVGNMTMTFDQNISTRLRHGERHVREHVYEPKIKISRGDEVGIFHMGSTVVMLYEKSVLDAEPEAYRGRHVKMGQALI